MAQAIAREDTANIPLPTREDKAEVLWPTTWDRLTEYGRVVFLSAAAVGEALVGWPYDMVQQLLDNHDGFSEYEGEMYRFVRRTLVNEGRRHETEDVTDAWIPFELRTELLFGTQRLALVNVPSVDYEGCETSKDRQRRLDETRLEGKKLTLWYEVPVMLQVHHVRDLMRRGEWHQ
jgi:hypothetical protein